jgi:Flp pilus assembly protein TadG
MASSWSRAIRSERGAAVVEMAVVTPLLLLMVFGILDFGRAMNYRNAATQLANEAARFASVNRDPLSASPPSCSSLKSYLETQADTPEFSTMLNNGSLAIAFPDGTSNVGDPVKMTVNVDFSWLPFTSNKGLGGSPGLTINGQATMRLEQPPGFSAGSC